MPNQTKTIPKEIRSDGGPHLAIHRAILRSVSENQPLALTSIAFHLIGGRGSRRKGAIRPDEDTSPGGPSGRTCRPTSTNANRPAPLDGAQPADSGKTISAHDLIIAATALARGLDVMTRDERSFGRIPGLSVVRL